MAIAFNRQILRRQIIVDEAHKWFESQFISDSQFKEIFAKFGSGIKSESLLMSVGLFLAVTLVLLGFFGVANFFVSDWRVLLMAEAVLSLLYLEFFVLKTASRYFSGISTALCWLAYSFSIVWISNICSGHAPLGFFLSGVFGACFAIRYLSKVATVVSLFFFSFAMLEGLYALQLNPKVVPTVFMMVLAMVCYAARHFQRRSSFYFWYDNFRVIEAFSLVLMALATNRLSLVWILGAVNHGAWDMGDAHGHFKFYWMTTIMVPVVYLYLAILKRDILWMRVGLIVLAFAVFTIQYFSNLNHPETTLALAGLLLLIFSTGLSRYLAKVRHGFTREVLLKERWFHVNAEASLMAQVNHVQPPESYIGGGGAFGGGGADGQY